MQVCTSLQTDNHANTPPLSFLQAGCPSCRPTNSVKALKDYILDGQRHKNLGTSKRVIIIKHIAITANFIASAVLQHSR